MFKQPPFKITPKILASVQEIFLLLGKIHQKDFKANSDSKLRKDNSIRTIKSSVAIEGNTLSLDQVTDILNGKMIVASQREISEVKNAIATYEKFDMFDAFKTEDLLEAHRLLMSGLTENPGRFRNSQVGIFKGGEAIHIAPSCVEVSGLMADLFHYLIEAEDSLLIKSCVFHYELEFIHPFTDGNGRIGRLWQQLILAKIHPVFKVICVEELLEKEQGNYYEALRQCDVSGKSTSFIEFMLKIILEALIKVNLHTRIVLKSNFFDRLLYARNLLNEFKRQDYMKLFPGISSATASRDLRDGINNKILEKSNSGNQTLYRFIKG